MVEECEGYGFVGCGGCVFDLFVCWDGVWVARLGEVYWEVDSRQEVEHSVYVYQFVWQDKEEYLLCMA